MKHGSILRREDSGKEVKKAFFDVRVFNPFAKTHRTQNLTNAYVTHEKEKKRHYNQRVIHLEHGSFTPFIIEKTLLINCKQEADSFKISTNIPYIMLQKIWNV